MLSTLILVCCHGIWIGNDTEDAFPDQDATAESKWLIADFQRGETPCLVQHLKTGIEFLVAQPESLLVLSGGPTRPETPLSEGESYARLARASKYWGLVDPDFVRAIESRIVIEARALDSFQNMLFSLAKFYEVTGAWPSFLTIITYEFKKARFLELHCNALKIPPNKIKFVGINPSYFLKQSADYDCKRVESVIKGENVNGFFLWEKDMQGAGQELMKKRTGRNHWQVSQDIFEDKTLVVTSGIILRNSGGSDVLDIGIQPWEAQRTL